MELIMANTKQKTQLPKLDMSFDEAMRRALRVKPVKKTAKRKK
jgi:hypothetical protein